MLLENQVQGPVKEKELAQKTVKALEKPALLQPPTAPQEETLVCSPTIPVAQVEKKDKGANKTNAKKSRKAADNSPYEDHLLEQNTILKTINNKYEGKINALSEENRLLKMQLLALQGIQPNMEPTGGMKPEPQHTQERTPSTDSSATMTKLLEASMALMILQSIPKQAQHQPQQSTHLYPLMRDMPPINSGMGMCRPCEHRTGRYMQNYYRCPYEQAERETQREEYRHWEDRWSYDRGNSWNGHQPDRWTHRKRDNHQRHTRNYQQHRGSREDSRLHPSQNRSYEKNWRDIQSSVIATTHTQRREIPKELGQHLLDVPPTEFQAREIIDYLHGQPAPTSHMAKDRRGTEEHPIIIPDDVDSQNYTPDLESPERWTDGVVTVASEKAQGLRDDTRDMPNNIEYPGDKTAKHEANAENNEMLHFLEKGPGHPLAPDEVRK